MNRPRSDRRHAAAAPNPHAAPANGSFGRFLLVGGTCTAIQYLLLAVLIDGFDWRPVLASGAAYAVAVMLNYELSRRWTFHGRPASWRSFLRFIAVSVAGLALNVLLFEAALRAGVPHYLVAQAIATVVTMGVNFKLYRFWAFRH